MGGKDSDNSSHNLTSLVHSSSTKGGPGYLGNHHGFRYKTHVPRSLKSAAPSSNQLFKVSLSEHSAMKSEREGDKKPSVSIVTS